MKLLTGIFSGVLALAVIGCDNVTNSEADDSVRTETEVISVDTVDAEKNYEVREKNITKVDTVGATTEYEVEKQVVTKTVDIDTTTEAIERENRAQMQEGDYETVEKEVETETVTEDVEVDSE